MILAPYRNPPYRTPTPKNRNPNTANNNNNNNSNKNDSNSSNPDNPASTPLAPPPNINVPPHAHHHPSPKRKRADSAASSSVTSPTPPTSLHIHIPAVRNTMTEDAVSESGANSPRSKVAERLSGLEISPVVASSFRGQSPWKKLKGQDEDEDEGEREREIELEIAETPQGSFEAEMMEIAETPNAYATEIGSPSPTSRSTSAEAMAIDTPLPPDSEDPGYDQATLTWQDSEITGHLIDATSADDDGEGINGVGFKPTSAMTYARSQRRKQQVSEWKAREAREARQRRLERRRGGSRERGGGGGEAGGIERRRTVRFAGVV